MVGVQPNHAVAVNGQAGVGTPSARKDPDVNNRWYFPFEGMVEMSFKRVPAGYVFGAPNPWLIGPRQYYLLNEQQKSEVAVQLRRMWGYLFVAIIVAVGVIVPVTLSGIDQHPVTAFAIDVLIG